MKLMTIRQGIALGGSVAALWVALFAAFFDAMGWLPWAR